MDLEVRVKDQDRQLADWQAKYSDKCQECESYISISEHRLEQYNELMQRKKDLEETRQRVFEGLEERIRCKEEEISSL